jgi:type II secretory pathway component PulF
MKVFIYKAIKNKKLISEEIEGKDEEEVAGKLREKGLEILSIKSKSGKKDEKEGDKKPSFMDRFKKVKKVEKVFLYKNISTMLQAGLPLPEVIDLMRDSVKNPILIEVLGQLKYDVESGNYISTSLAKHPKVFATSEIAMIQAGEAGGKLPESFYSLYEDAESENKLVRDVKGAMMYPAIILSILLLVVILLLVFVLPQLTGFFNQANIEVPLMTRVIMAVSDFSRKNYILITIILVVTLFGFRLLLKRSKKAQIYFDKIVIKIPWLGKQFKLFYIHKVARTLGLLIKSGVPILQALEIVEKSVPHHGYSASIGIIRKDIKSGGKLSTSIEKFDDLYPIFVSRMLKVGDQTGNTSDSLNNISEYYRDELKETLENISSIIEPVLMVILGVGVAFIAVSVLLPLYKIVSGINQMQK